MLPSPFVYMTTPASIEARLRRVDEHSAHVYVVYNDCVLMLHSLRQGKICGPGGKVDRGETLLEGLTRELHEEIPVLAEFILSRLGNAVGMWRRSEAGVHNTFLIEATPADFDVWAKCDQLKAAIEHEKSTLNRLEYMEADGGIVLAPIDSMIRRISDWKHTGQKGDPQLECYVGPMERNYMALRRIFAPYVEELTTLRRLLQLPQVVRNAFDVVQGYYKIFSDNALLEAGGTRYCVHCGTERFDTSRYKLMCGLCGAGHEVCVRDLRAAEEANTDSSDLTVVACRVIQHYESMQ